jgi:hypothetical protein
MVVRIPVIHRVHNFNGLMDRDYRPLRENNQIGIGNHRGYLDNLILLRLQACHFQVNPDQIIAI